MEKAVFQRRRKAESGRDRFGLSAGCRLSAWGEEEADKWEWVGVETGAGEKICL